MDVSTISRFAYNSFTPMFHELVSKYQRIFEQTASLPLISNNAHDTGSSRSSVSHREKTKTDFLSCSLKQRTPFFERSIMFMLNFWDVHFTSCKLPQSTTSISYQCLPLLKGNQNLSNNGHRKTTRRKKPVGILRLFSYQSNDAGNHCSAIPLLESLLSSSHSKIHAPFFPRKHRFCDTLYNTYFIVEYVIYNV